MERLVIGQASVSRGRVNRSRQGAINVRFSTGGRSASHTDGNMVPLTISKIVAQVEVIRRSAIRELERQLTIKEVDYITGGVATRDEPLVNYGQSSMNRVSCPNP